MTTMYAITRIVPAVLGLVLGTLLLSSCGVTEPDTTPWQDVAEFSWPTRKGVTMKYQTIQADTVLAENEVTVDLGSATDATLLHDGQQMYMLSDPLKIPTSQVHYLPQHDTLVVKQDVIGATYALVSPLEKGHKWVAAYTNKGDTALMAEIIELFSYRKVEGKVYQNVVVVKYNRLKRLSNIYKNEEWIRFYAQGVGEIMTILNVYPESTLSNPLPQQEQRRVLIETTALN